MSALEIWTNASGGVMLRNPATGVCRELKDVQSVTFVDGSAFPSPIERAAPEKTVWTLAGQSVRVVG